MSTYILSALKVFHLFSRKTHSVGKPMLRTQLRASFQCPREERLKFKDSHAQMTISVGAPAHEGERLESTVDLINRSFKQCTLMLDDSLQWPTLGLTSTHLNKNALIELAIYRGDEWLTKNQAIYERFTIPYRIIRWKNWQSHPEFQPAIERMRAFYYHTPAVREAINENIRLFLERYEKTTQTDLVHDKRANDLCREYLIEECGIMREFWPTLGTHYEIYPSKRSPAMAMTYNLFIKPLFPDFLKSVALRFERRNIELAKEVIEELPLNSTTACLIGR